MQYIRLEKIDNNNIKCNEISFFFFKKNCKNFPFKYLEYEISKIN